MSLNPDIRDQAYQFFIEEAQELLQVLETGLLDLRQDHSTPKVHELMRAAHSIKGGAASVELSAIGLLAHRLEDFFKALYSDEVDFDAELEGLLLQGYDCLSHPLLEQIEAGAFDEEAALLRAEPVFAALEVRLEEALKNADNYIPSSNDLGVDIVSSIFEVDVVQALDRLQAIVDDPTNHNPAAELAETLEMFAGFAELFNLSGFTDIVLTAQAALNSNSQNALAIIEATLADCTQAAEQVLAGDRERGGTVSLTLIELAQGAAIEGDLAEQAIALGEDEIWSTSPADDIFGSLSPETAAQNLAFEQVDLTEDELNLWSTSPTEASLIDADHSLETATEEEIATELASNVAKVEQINQLFNSISDEQDGLARLDTDNVWSSIADDKTSVEDIFGSLAQDEAEEAEADDISQLFELAAEKTTAAGDSLPEATAFDEISADSDHLWSNVPNSEPNAEDIFGNIPDESMTIAEDDQPEADDISQLFDLVGDEPVADTVPNEVVAFDEIPEDTSGLWSSVPDSEPLVEDVFASVPDEPSATPDVLKTELKVDDIPPTSDITATVNSITNIFESLPNAEPEKLFPPVQSQSEPKPTRNTTAANVTNKKAAAKLSVRVDLERLERMNNLIGELTINRNSLSLQNEQLQSNVSELEQKFFRFRGVTKQLQEISDRLLLEARSRDHLSFNSEQQATNNLGAEFDALEMDSYSQLYSSLQVILEEIVQLEESVEDITIFAQQSDRTIDGQRQMLAQIRDELMWVRMLPLDQILQRFPRTLRDLASKYHKPVDLKLTGTNVLVDKAVLEKLSDPLLHLLRNGFDHGIENPEERTQQGKSATGSIEIRAYYQGNQTVIEVKDDGKGLDLNRITQKGIEQGLISPQEAATASKERLYELIFEPGFSTASKVSEISGRGVGMNIVRSQVETLKGKISVISTPGAGSTFMLRLPLTLTIAKLLVCSLGATAFAIPSDSIEEIIIPDAGQIKLANGQKFLSHDGKLIPIYILREILGYNCPIPDTDSNSKAFKTIAPPEDWAAPLLLLRRGQRIYALEVVSLLSEQELVIKPYGKAIAAPSYSYGCTILSDGSLIPAFDGSALIGSILGETSQIQRSNSTVDSSPQSDLADDNPVREILERQITALKTIMVVDDSTALRRTMALTLEKEGYRVVQKKDGKEALNGFKQHPELDLIICDVEMPVMNGFEFLGMRRRDSALAQVPTFMLTSRSGAKHRHLAKQLGADGYFTKPYVEQEFIQEVKRILASDHQLENPAAPKAIAIKTKTILVIDDSSALRKTLALSLERQGYRVLQGRDGQEGIDQLRSNLQTDLVICDIEMPNVNGFEFLTLRRQESKLTEIPIVMLTSRSTEKHRTLAASLGAAGFFTKPYVEERFIEEIKQYIREH
ncbi:MAG: response regulator [Cyanobacteria bacterium J06582_2]